MIVGVGARAASGIATEPVVPFPHDHVHHDAFPEQAPAYAMTPQQFEQRLRALAAKFPDLVELKDVGDSALKHSGSDPAHPGHDIFALVLTDKRATGPKPKVAHLGALHGTEMVAPSLLLQFAEELLTGYGRDPQATMLLQQRELHLMPMVNPDGIEGMFRRWAGEDAAKVPSRVNANRVNLNRNFPYGWGGLGSTAEPRDENYRGPAPGSEPETQAVMGYFLANKPDLLIDWHNSGRLVLYPWGETPEPGQTTQADKDVAVRIASRNGYTAKASSQLYPVTGSSVDWAHGTLGIPAVTIESGSLDYLTDSGYEKILRANAPVLWDMAAIAQDPAQASVGPDTWRARVHKNAIELWASQDRPGRQAIRGAELVLDPTAAPGTGIPLPAADGAFDSADERVQAPIPAELPSDGLAYVRTQGADGNWGALRAFWIKDPVVPAPDTVR